MKPEITINNKTATVVMNDGVTHLDFSEALKSLEASADGLEKVVVDCKGLSVIRSEMIGQLVFLRKWAAGKEIQPILLDMVDGIKQVLDISNLLQLFEVKYSE